MMVDKAMNAATPTVLVIDDDPQVSQTLQRIVARMGLSSLRAASLAEGRKLLGEHDVEVVFLDVRLPDGSGLDALPAIIGSPSSPEVIILTGQGDPDGAELAIEGGVWDYLVKPTSIKDTMLSLERALKYRQQKKSCRPAPVALNLNGVVGSGSGMRACFDLVAQAARSDAGTLITGETGTGKELLARTIHANSARASRAFVVVDCASLTENLVESALFGHKKGAFTGADRDSIGLIRTADSGTLFLDEVGELPLTIQKAFLRVLQEKRFRPLGDVHETTSDFRLLAATNRNLAAMVEQGSFRSDLLFRLKTIHITVPPLRERPEDIKPLAMYHVNRLCDRYGVPNKGFDPELFDYLRAYCWPGNVRELFNVVEMAFVSSGESKVLYAMHLPNEVRIAVTRASLHKGARTSQEDLASQVSAAVCTLPSVESGNMTLREYKTAMEKDYLEKLAATCGNDVESMLSASGLSKSHLYSLLKKHFIALKAE
jgi:two-component system NtrC family response regulator